MLERLKILNDNKVISDEVYVTCVDLHNKEMSSINLTEFNSYTVAMTHLAMAMERVKNGEIVNKMDDTIIADLKNQERFNDVYGLVTEIVGKFDFEVPEAEVQYLWLHFLNIYNEKGE